MIIDFHVYIGKSMVEGQLSVEDLLRSMEETGIDMSVLCPVKTLDSSYREQNAYVAQLQKKYPDKFAAYCRVDPNTGELGLEVFRRGMEEQGLKGMLLHPWEDTYTINDQRVFPYIELAGKYNVPVMIETKISSDTVYHDPWGPGGQQRLQPGGCRPCHRQLPQYHYRNVRDVFR